ncbi:unnamed protein product [Orchesella dallaii]|uniref:Cyclic nucleotide phosphodiesterase catalytic domain-containing protein n=1 Tax=Orchesella dallaii TaxID=48710 RepID=A0ABP1RT01_9HEXA
MKARSRPQMWLLSFYIIYQFSGCHSEDPGTMYLGFVFDATTASSIKAVTDAYLNSTLLIPTYRDFLQNISSTAGIDNVLNYYVKPLDPNTQAFDPEYHVTLKYCGDDQTTCEEYKKKNSQYISKVFELHLVGYVLTNRTFGIRVNLTEAQLPLFDNTKADEQPSRQFEILTTSATLDLPGIRFETLELPPSLPASNSRAHVTLGCGPGISAVTTGPDLLQAIEYEIDSDGSVTSVSFDNIRDPVDPQEQNMRVTQYIKEGTEDPVFVIYPSVKLIANATLLPYNNKQTNSAEVLTVFKLAPIVSIIAIAITLQM